MSLIAYIKIITIDNMNKQEFSDMIYSTLGIRKISEKEKEILLSNLDSFYNISYCSFYNANNILFTNFIKNDITLNNQNKLVKLLKKKRRIGVTGYKFNALLKNKSNKKYYKNVFLKELPIFDPTNIDLYYNNDNSISESTQMMHNLIYNTNHYTNVEILINYLTSKLVEINVTPHFSKYYGSFLVKMNKFTYDITESNTILNNIDSILDKSNVKCIQYTDNIYLEYNDVPVYLIVNESINYDIDDLKANQTITYDFLVMLTFSIFSTISTIVTLFEIKHNDLHLGNIMLEKTDKEYLYYEFNNIKYKVPTYGYIVKIIDWGRGTYDFNKHSGKNDIFLSTGECFEQYIYKRN